MANEAKEIGWGHIMQGLQVMSRNLSARAGLGVRLYPTSRLWI